MPVPFYDRVTKDFFFQDRPRLLNRLVGGKPVREIINSDLPKTLERRADMVLLVDPRELHHLEFQSTNFAGLPYRQGVDCFLLAERYKKRRIFQTAIYFGQRPMRMASSLDVGAAVVQYRVIDIREFDAMEMADSGRPPDLVLATLAGGGKENLKAILERIYALDPEARNRALAQVSVLAGLRRTTETFRMEMKRMGLVAEMRRNPFLREMIDEKGKESLRLFLAGRFGELPEWANSRIEHGTYTEVDEWIAKSGVAPTLESLLKSHTANAAAKTTRHRRTTSGR